MAPAFQVLLFAALAAALAPGAWALSRPLPPANISTPANYSLPSFSISSAFDGGSLTLLYHNGPGDIHINLTGDPFTVLEQTSFHQRWMFRVNGVKGVRVVVTVHNANDAYTFINSTFPNCWGPLYKARASYDKANWFQIRTGYNGTTGFLKFEIRPKANTVYLGYWDLVPIQRMENNVARWQTDPRVLHRVVGKSVLGRDIDLLIMGKRGKGKKHIWITSGQHPGEVQHLLWVEGFMDRLLSAPADSYAQQLITQAVIFVGPNLNPDGIFLGYHRTNALGYNLNRMWNRSSTDTSPELVGIQAAMFHYGVDFELDIHSDEGSSYNEVLYQGPGIPNWNQEINVTQIEFDRILVEASGGDYPGTAYSYDPLSYGPPPDTQEPGTYPLWYADSWTGNAFRCLSATVEMPFQDNILQVNWETGWGTDRSIRWGATFVEAIARALPWIKGHGPPPAPVYNATFYPSNPALEQYTPEFEASDPLKLCPSLECP